MVSLTASRHQPKHARNPRAAHAAPEDTQRQRFWSYIIWADRKDRGLRTDPEDEAAMQALGREFESWQRERQQGQQGATLRL